jgi:Leucine-rich repeat (LRR) protein
LGDAGIGKSTLIGAWRQLAREQSGAAESALAMDSPSEIDEAIRPRHVVFDVIPEHFERFGIPAALGRTLEEPSSANDGPPSPRPGGGKSESESESEAGSQNNNKNNTKIRVVACDPGKLPPAFGEPGMHTDTGGRNNGKFLGFGLGPSQSDFDALGRSLRAHFEHSNLIVICYVGGLTGPTKREQTSRWSDLADRFAAFKPTVCVGTKGDLSATWDRTVAESAIVADFASYDSTRAETCSAFHGVNVDSVLASCVLAVLRQRTHRKRVSGSTNSGKAAKSAPLPWANVTHFMPAASYSMDINNAEATRSSSAAKNAKKLAGSDTLSLRDVRQSSVGDLVAWVVARSKLTNTDTAVGGGSVSVPPTEAVRDLIQRSKCHFLNDPVPSKDGNNAPRRRASDADSDSDSDSDANNAEDANNNLDSAVAQPHLVFLGDSADVVAAAELLLATFQRDADDEEAPSSKSLGSHWTTSQWLADRRVRSVTSPSVLEDFFNNLGLLRRFGYREAVELAAAGKDPHPWMVSPPGRWDLLTELDVSQCGLVCVPPALQQLTGLEVVDLSSNKIAVIPEFLWERLALRSLNICANEIQRVPAPASGRFGLWCDSLERLDLSWNRLSKPGSVCGELSSLSRLRVLDLGNNSAAIGNSGQSLNPPTIPTLESLSIEQFSSQGNFPMQVCESTRLKCFCAASSQLRRLPLEFCRLTDLLLLDFSSNSIAELPVELFLTARRLRSLKLSWNQLTEIPGEIENLEDLQVLQVAHNQLSRLPETLSQCSHLRVLHCSYNEALEQLPLTIGSLQELAVLKCVSSREHNPSFLPNSFVRLESLTKVLLSHNPGITQKLMCWQWLPVAAVHSQTPSNFRDVCFTLLLLHGSDRLGSTLTALPRDLVLLVVRWVARAWDNWPKTGDSDRIPA